MMHIKFHSKRHFRAVNPKRIGKELDEMAAILIGNGCLIKRTHTGTIILELEDRFQYYIPEGSRIEEIIITKEEVEAN